MNSPHRVVSPILVLLLVMALSSCKQQVVAEKVHASIMNRLGEGRNLTLHCQSKDNDLGLQTVADGDEFGWDFSVNVAGTTLFYCDLGWEMVQQYHFDAYSFARDRTRCASQCLWLISAEGMYNMNGQTGLWEYMYHWPN